MPMLPNILASGLNAMEPTDNEPSAVQGWTQALKDYFSTMAAGAAIILPTAVELAAQSIPGALSGMSISGAAPAKIQAAVVAFWGMLATQLPNTVFPGFNSVTPPPPLATIGTGIMGAGTASVAAGLSKPDANQALALVIHTACIGGQAIPPPPATPVTIV
jgi:hypothetical protein